MQYLGIRREGIKDLCAHRGDVRENYGDVCQVSLSEHYTETLTRKHVPEKTRFAEEVGHHILNVIDGQRIIQILERMIQSVLSLEFMHRECVQVQLYSHFLVEQLGYTVC